MANGIAPALEVIRASKFRVGDSIECNVQNQSQVLRQPEPDIALDNFGNA